MKDYISFCKDVDGNYMALRASEQLKDTYSSAEKYSKKQWLEDLAYNGYEVIKTIVEEMMIRRL
ncbi:MAG: hypothetical protein PUK21_01370 [Peptostreptococcaceae bacterium]|nr:hypothetical protein [Peptostreptococcaceae bacterium]MDY5738658.1 hypothetical protein [Anaerovoracaceae bacterium]